MQDNEIVPAERTERVLSVDVLRGFNFVWILGGDGVMLTTAAMLRHFGAPWARLGDALNDQFHHVVWDGLTFYDFVFPLFVFITGVSIVLSVPRLVERKG